MKYHYSTLCSSIMNFAGMPTQNYSCTNLLQPNILVGFLDQQLILKKKLSFWRSWEEGKEDFEPEQFIHAIFGCNELNESKWLILYDDCFKDSTVLELNLTDLLSFKSLLNLQDPHNSLLEPFDHIFFNNERQRLKVIHHDGMLFEYGKNVLG